MAQHLSREEFHRLAENQAERYERIVGEPVAMRSERGQHVRVKNRVCAALDGAIRSAGLDCEAPGDGVPIEVNADTEIQHYLIVRARWQEIIHHWRTGESIATRLVNLCPVRLEPPGIVPEVGDIHPAGH